MDDSSSSSSSSSSCSSGFVGLSLAGTLSYLEQSHHKLRRATSFLKHVAELESAYARDLLKLVSTGETTYRSMDDKKSGGGGGGGGTTSTSQSQWPSDILFFTAVEAIKRMANQHQTHAKELQTQVAAPLKLFRIKAEDARKKHAQTHSRVLSSVRDTTESINKERTACAKLIEQYKQESQGGGGAVASASRGLFSKKVVADKATVAKAINTYQQNFTQAQQQINSQHELCSATLREIQALEEEKLRVLGVSYSIHSSLLRDHLLVPFSTLTVDLDAKLQDYRPADEINNICSGRGATFIGPRETLTNIQYQLPCSGSDVLDDSFLAGNPKSVKAGTGPFSSGTAAGAAEAESKTVPASVTAKFATSASSSIVPGSSQTPKLPIATNTNSSSSTGPAAESSIAARAAKMGAVPLGMFTPAATSSASTSSSASSSSSTSASASASASASSSPSDDTLLRVLLPAGLGVPHITLAASQLPVVKHIKAKIIAKLERQGSLSSVSSASISSGSFRLCVSGSSGIDISDSSSMASLLDTAKMYLPPGKPIELMLHIDNAQHTQTATTATATGTGTASRPSPVLASTPASSSSSSSAGAIPVSASTTLPHVERAKIVRKKKKGTGTGTGTGTGKKGFSSAVAGIFGKTKTTTKTKRTKPATGGLGAFDASAANTDSDSVQAQGITLTNTHTTQQQQQDDEDEDEEEEHDEEGDGDEDDDEEEEEGEDAHSSDEHQQDKQA